MAYKLYHTSMCLFLFIEVKSIDYYSCYDVYNEVDNKKIHASVSCILCI